MKSHAPLWLALGLLAVIGLGLCRQLQLKLQMGLAEHAMQEVQDHDARPTPPPAPPMEQVPVSEVQDRDSRLKPPSAQPREPVPKPDLLNAADPEVAGEALKKFFENKGFAGLADLQNDPDTSLALQAAWELALWPGSDQVPPRPQRFLGFVEGRLGVKVPPRWEYDIVRHCLGNDTRDERLVAATRAYLPLFDFLRDARDGDTLLEPKKLDQDLTRSAPGSTNMERKDGVVTFRVGQAAVQVQEKALPKYISGVTVCAAHLGPERSFIAYHDNCGDPFPLLCVDSRSGKVLWRSRVWASGSMTSFRPMVWFGSQRDLAFVSTDQEILLFGNGPQGGCFVEAFDLNTGRCTGRFRTEWFPGDSSAREQWRQRLRQRQ